MSDYTFEDEESRKRDYLYQAQEWNKVLYQFPFKFSPFLLESKENV